MEPASVLGTKKKKNQVFTDPRIMMREAPRTPSFYTGSEVIATHIIVPEFNVIGWMAKEIKATIPRSERVIAGPRVCGGVTMPPEIIVEKLSARLACVPARSPVAVNT